jgi:hypothetical protein
VSQIKIAGWIDDLPLVLAGPIVRRVEPDSVTVWLALRQAREVTLRVYETSGDGSRFREVMRGVRQTVSVGLRLHIVAVTATGTEALEWGQSYCYNVDFGEEDGDLFAPGIIADRDLPELSRLRAAKKLLYMSGPVLPSFCLPPAELDKVRIVHGSCRRPHNSGGDALVALDRMLGAAFRGDGERPQMLVLSGDQIYADSMPASVLDSITHLGDMLLGYDEDLPGIDATPRMLPPNKRRVACRDYVGHPEPAKHHLLGFGEYCAMYLLVLSERLWQLVWRRVEQDISEEDAANLERFQDELVDVRRALANTAVYTTFDDHEITDDWNLTYDWCRKVYEKPLGRRMVQNGMVAFALFQAWGNTPEAFAEGSGEPGEQLLEMVGRWHPDAWKGWDGGAEHIWHQLLSIPESASELDHEHGPPRLVHGPGAIAWHYTVKTPAFELIALDVRTMRAFPGDSELDPPALLSDEALAAQLPLVDDEPPPVTLVIAATPVFTMPSTHTAAALTRLLYYWQGRGKSDSYTAVYGPDRGDKWQQQSRPFEDLLAALSSRERVVFLCGDVHAGFAARARYHIGDRDTVFGQLVSSGLKRQGPARLVMHRLGYNFPWPIPRLPEPSLWYGWLADGGIEMSRNNGHRDRLPDWRYRVEFVRADRDSREGREIVGTNNIGDVTFDWRDGKKSAIQSLWWRADEQSPLEPRSRFVVSLANGADDPV